MCNGEIDVLSSYSVIVADCFAFAMSFEGVSFQFCPRDANQMAHHLAKHLYDGHKACNFMGWLSSQVVPTICNY